MTSTQKRVYICPIFRFRGMRVRGYMKIKKKCGRPICLHKQVPYLDATNERYLIDDRLENDPDQTPQAEVHDLGLHLGRNNNRITSTLQQ